MRPLATPSLGLKGGFWAAREVSGKTGSGLVRLASSDRSEKNRTEGGNDAANTSWDQRRRPLVECRRPSAKRARRKPSRVQWTGGRRSKRGGGIPISVDRVEKGLEFWPAIEPSGLPPTTYWPALTGLFLWDASTELAGTFQQPLARQRCKFMFAAIRR